MSKFLDTSDQVAAVLAALPELDGVGIIVDRQKDIDTMVETAVSQSAGAAVVIFWAGGDNEDPPAAGPRLRCNYEITLYCRPVLMDGGTPADSLAAAICSALHHWTPSPASVETYERMTVTRVAMVPDPEFLAYRVFTSVNVTI